MRLRWKHAVPALALSLAQCNGATDPNAAGLADFVIGFCSDGIPVFVAYQNQGGTWTPFTLSATSTATIRVTPKFGLATVGQSGSDYTTNVYFVTRAELAPVVGACHHPVGFRSVNGSVSAFSIAQAVEVNMAGSIAFLFPSGPTSFSLFGLPQGPMDLVGVRQTNAIPDRVIVRRAIDVPSSATIPVLNFAATEAVATVSSTLTFTGNLPSETLDVGVSLTTANGTRHRFDPLNVGSTSATMPGIPASLTQATDLHEIIVVAAPPDGASARGLYQFNRFSADRSVVLGPALRAPAVTSSGSSPMIMRAQVPSQTDYNALMEVEFNQVDVSASRSVTVLVTSGYAGATPATWEVQTPDLSGLAGYPASASLTSGATTWAVLGADATPRAFIGGAGADGSSVHFAFRTSNAVSALVAGNQGALRGPGRIDLARRLFERR